MAKYLGEVPVSTEDSPYKGYDASKWALLFITMYGGIDGAHHKDWVLDQVARALHGGVPTIKLASWDDGQTEYRVSSIEATAEYSAWVETMKGVDEDGEDMYDYSEGTAP